MHLFLFFYQSRQSARRGPAVAACSGEEERGCGNYFTHSGEWRKAGCTLRIVNISDHKKAKCMLKRGNRRFLHLGPLLGERQKDALLKGTLQISEENLLTIVKSLE